MSAQSHQLVDSFAMRLRGLRERSGLTQEELAERAGLTPHAVSALERGVRTRPYPHTVRSLAEALGVSETERAELIAAVPTRRNAQATTVSTASPVSPAPVGEDGSPRLMDWTVPPTRLYGRDADVAAVLAAARHERARLITLTGVGGVGKTRLAAAVSDELAVDHPDGVVLIALASVTDASSVAAVIARALGLAGSDGGQAIDPVAEHLSPLRLLLVLDNFEHLLTAAGDVASLVSRCPHITIMVTSRSPLRVRGEREFTVGPLALPHDDVSTWDELESAPAGALVLDRARAVAPALDSDPDQVRALGEMCRRLAGLPLAIELATARLRVLTPRSLLSRLDDVTATSAARDLPERQRTMRATLDWSYGLLTSEQQALFRLLGAFRAGATLERIEELSSQTGTLPAENVLDELEQLVEHSLVLVRVGVDARHRYDMLEPVAQYARSLLIGDEAQRAARAHAQLFLASAERAAHGYERDDQVAWLARTEADQANILVAIDRSLDLGDAETAGRITWAMWLYWWLRGHLLMGRRRAEQCLAADLSAPVLARVHLTAATMAYAAGDFTASGQHWSEAFRLGTELDDSEVGCKGRAGTGLAALAAGDLQVSADRFREALQLGVSAGEAGVWLRSLVHVWLGTVRLLQGDSSEAVAEIRRGLDLARARGDRLSTYVALYNLAQAAIAASDHTAARQHLEEGIRLSEQTRDMANLAYFLDALAVVESAEGQAQRVPVLVGAAQSLRETVGAQVYGYYIPDESLRAAAEAAARSELGDDAFDDAVDAGRAMAPPDIVRLALTPS
jgi:predicted ATPase/transcriptional regulator with XRE-family HTH domain